MIKSLNWFNISAPSRLVRGRLVRAWNLFYRNSKHGRFWGAGILQIGRRHLFYVGDSGISILFMGTTQ